MALWHSPVHAVEQAIGRTLSGPMACCPGRQGAPAIEDRRRRGGLTPALLKTVRQRGGEVPDVLTVGCAGDEDDAQVFQSDAIMNILH
jgi:hypothetical protein